MCNVIMYFHSLIFELGTTMELPSNVKLTKSGALCKNKSTVYFER